MGDMLPVHVTVVIPTRNEEAAIVDTIRSIPNDGWCEKLDFLIVDGNSSDRTRELAAEEGAWVVMEPRKGYGRAYRTGFALAPGDIIVTLDADCTYPGEEVPGLVRKLVEEDLKFITCDRLRRAEMRPTHDGMPLSEEMKINARRCFGRKKAVEVSVPYRVRVGDAEINTWGDGWLNFRFLFAKRFGINRTRSDWGPDENTQV